jgi:DNA-binding CsgD family transcriptional regulator
MQDDVNIFDEFEWKLLVEGLSLSPRQGQIVYHLASGKSDKQIAKELGVAVPTVRTHLGRLFSKFRVQDRTELVIHVFRHFKTINRLNDHPQQ